MFRSHVLQFSAPRRAKLPFTTLALTAVVVLTILISPGSATAAKGPVDVEPSPKSLAELPARCLSGVLFSVDGGHAWRLAKWREAGVDPEPYKFNSAHYGHGGEGYWYLEVPNGLLLEPSVRDKVRGYAEIQLRLTFDFQWSKTGGSVSGPCVTGMWSDTGDFESGGGPKYRLAGHEKPRRTGSSAIWNHHEPDCFTGGADAEVRIDPGDWIMKHGALGIWEGIRQIRGLQHCGDRTKSWTDVGGQLVGGIDSITPFLDIHQGAGQRKPELNGGDPVNGRTNQQMTFRYSIPTGERRFGGYGAAAIPKSWYAFSLALERRDRRGIFKDGWHEPSGHTNFVIALKDVFPYRHDTIGTLADRDLGLPQLSRDVASEVAENVYRDLQLLAEFVLIEAKDWALDELGLPHAIDLNCIDHPNVAVTEPDVRWYVRLIQACAHNPGRNQPAELRIGNPSRLWLEVLLRDGGAELDSFSLGSLLLLSPGEQADWTATRAGVVTLQNSLTTDAFLATVIGETLRNAVAVVLADSDELTQIQKAVVAVVVSAVIPAIVDTFVEYPELSLLAGAGPAGFLVALPLLTAMMSNEAFSANLSDALEAATKQLASLTVQFGLSAGANVALEHLFQAGAIKAELALVAVRSGITLIQLIEQGLAGAQTRAIRGTATFDISPAACPGCELGSTSPPDLESEDTTELGLTTLPTTIARSFTRTLDLQERPSGGRVHVFPYRAQSDTYPLGGSVQLTAAPDSGYRFVRWEGHLSSARNPATISMTADRAVSAVFERIASHNDGDCAAGSVVRPDHYCRYPGTNRVFSVSPTSGAQSPWSPELNRTGIKVDPFVDGQAHTIQAQELADRSWRIEVIGAWGDLGACRAPLTIEPGQFCTRSGTTEQFRVYAVDELIPSDTRVRFADGYAVLFANPALIDDREVLLGNLRGLRGTGRKWSITDMQPEPTLSASISVGTGHACTIAVGGRIVCWGDDLAGQARAPSGAFVHVTTGDRHSCAVGNTGSIRCWGANDERQATPPSGRFLQISAGDQHTCAVRETGSIRCWGANSDGQASPPSGQFRHVSAGDRHNCAVSKTGSVRCWGTNSDGQASPPSGQFRQVSAGKGHSCAVSNTGSIRCWGANGDGQAESPSGQFVQITAGDGHSCAVSNSGSIQCWGANEIGRVTPSDSRFIRLSAGVGQSCGVRVDGSVACWDASSDGRAGPPSGIFTLLSTGPAHSCGIRNDGSVECWGEDRAGAAMPPTGRFTVVSVGARHTCGVRGDGSVACWGYDGDGRSTPPAGQFVQLSVGGDYDRSQTCGIQVGGFVECWGGDAVGEAMAPYGRFVQISAAARHTCGVDAGGSVTCWGTDFAGAAMLPFGDFSAVSTSDGYACALLASGEVECWGSNVDGRAAAPSGRFAQISAAGYHVCGVQVDGSILCWGRDTDGKMRPPPGRFSQVSASSEQTCALRRDGAVQCWGATANEVVQPPTGLRAALTTVREKQLGEAPAAPITIRIAAARLADGRTEFGVDPSVGDRVLPSPRILPANPPVGRWLNSGLVALGGQEIGRINARKLSDGRIEFAFTPTGGERILPDIRHFPRVSTVNRWLRSSPITIRAASPLTTYTLRAIADPSNGSGGYVEITGGTLVSPGVKSFAAGARAVLEARTNPGWRFVRWSGALSGSNARQAQSMDGDKVVTAHWERVRASVYTLRAIGDPSDGSGGYVEISGGTLVSPGVKSFAAGARAVLEARTNPGWRFVRWSGALSGSSARQALSMDSDKVVTAHWERVSTSVYTLRAIGDPSNGSGGYVEISGGTLVSPGVKSFAAGARAVLEARTNPGWRFVRWSGALSGSNARQALSMDSDKVVTAHWERVSTSVYTLRAIGDPSDGSGGYVEISGGTLVSPGVKSFAAGARAVLEAHTNQGWRFVGWSGAAGGSEARQSLTMSADKVVTAHWERVQQASNDASRRTAIAQALFRGLAANQLNYDYNNWDATVDGRGNSCDGYQGGHSGWDLQTKSVVGSATANVVFYSLTSGEVVATGGTFGMIAVYNSSEDNTIVYLHARRIDVRRGQRINVGTPLGIQGNVGLSSNQTVSEHVHVEVRNGRRTFPGCGAISTIDPIDYLYRSMSGG